MKDTIVTTVERLAELAQATPGWPNQRYSAEWADMFESLSRATAACHIVEKEYIVRLYRARLESAVARGEDGLDGLDEAVSQLANSSESNFAFALISWRDRGFFLWLTEDMSSLVAAWRAIDRQFDR